MHWKVSIPCARLLRSVCLGLLMSCAALMSRQGSNKLNKLQNFILSQVSRLRVLNLEGLGLESISGWFLSLIIVDNP